MERGTELLGGAESKLSPGTFEKMAEMSDEELGMLVGEVRSLCLLAPTLPVRALTDRLCQLPSGKLDGVAGLSRAETREVLIDLYAACVAAGLKSLLMKTCDGVCGA